MTIKAANNRIRRSFLLAVLACSLACCFVGCGKKGDPIPDRSIDAFSFTDVKCEVVGGALVVRGAIKGAAANLDSILLEVQPVTDELCEGCPFLAVDQKRIEAGNAVVGDDLRKFDVSFRPSVMTEVYRWRLTGENAHPGVPPFQTEVMTAGVVQKSIPVPVLGKDELGEILAREEALPRPATIEAPGQNVVPAQGPALKN